MINTLKNPSPSCLPKGSLMEEGEGGGQNLLKSYSIPRLVGGEAHYFLAPQPIEPALQPRS
jgi:hypothetical protein